MFSFWNYFSKSCYWEFWVSVKLYLGFGITVTFAFFSPELWYVRVEVEKRTGVVWSYQTSKYASWSITSGACHFTFCEIIMFLRSGWIHIQLPLNIIFSACQKYDPPHMVDKKQYENTLLSRYLLLVNKAENWPVDCSMSDVWLFFFNSSISVV